MSALLTIALVLAVLAITYTITITLAWGLIHGAALIRRDETRHRTDGPVSIDPNRKHRIHIRGYGYGYGEAYSRNREALRHAERYGYDVTIPPNSIEGINP